MAEVALDHFQPFADLPVLDDTVEHEWIVGGESLRGFASREDSHRALARVGERADHQQGAAIGKTPPMGSMLGGIGVEKA